MIVDMHTHPATPEAMAAYGYPYQYCAQLYANERVSHFYGRTALTIPLAETIQCFRDAGLDMAVMVNDAASQHGTGYTNDTLIEALAPYANYVKVFCGVDPHLGRPAARELRRALTTLGCIGLKIHTAYQRVHPNDKLMYSLYEVLCEEEKPVLFHTGVTYLGGTPIRYSQPLYVDEVACDFPELKIIMAHWGWPWVDEALAVTWRHEHVYVDVSGHLPRYLPARVWHYMNVEGLRERFFFGSDYPYISPGHVLNAYQAFTEWRCPMCNRTETWKEGVKEALLGGNFLAMMKGVL